MTMPAMPALLPEAASLTAIVSPEAWPAFAFWGGLFLFVVLAVGWMFLWNHILRGRIAAGGRRLQESEAFLERLFLQSPYPMWVADHDGTMLIMNDACQSLFGIDRPEEITGRYNLFRDSVLRKLGVEGEIRKAFEGEPVTLTDHYDPGKVRGFTLPSKPLYLRTSFAPIFDLDGRVKHVLVMHEDITGRSRAEEELRERNRELWALLEASSALASSLDPEALFRKMTVLVRSALPAADMGGLFLYELETDSLRLVAPIGFEVGGELRLVRGTGVAGRVFAEGHSVLLSSSEEVAEAVESLTPERRKLLERHFGERKLESAIGIPLQAKGRLIGVLSLFSAHADRKFTDRDVKLMESFADQAAAALDNAYLYEALVKKSKEHEEVNRRLREAIEELKTLDQMKTNLLANVSHELRTPLIAIMGYTDLILTGKLGDVGDELRSRLEVVIRNAARLAKLIDDLLEFSRTELGETALQVSRFDLRDILDEGVEAIRPRAESRGVDVQVSLPQGDLTLKGDRDKILQVFTNLLDNAVKFNREQGKVHVEVKPVGKGLARVNVSDTGIGISKEEVEKVFDRFYQVDSSTSRRYGGTGIGLALVKSYVNLHGGRVKVRSEPGKGSTFTITLPVYDEKRDSGRYEVAHPAGPRGSARLAPGEPEASRRDEEPA